MDDVTNRDGLPALRISVLFSLSASCLYILYFLCSASDYSYSGVRKLTNPPELSAPGSGIRFEKNEGQSHSSAKYLSHGSGYALYISPLQHTLRLSGENGSSRIDTTLLGANSVADIYGTDPLSSYSNYIKGPDRDGWIRKAGHFAGVYVEDVYEDIDLRYHSDRQQLEYDFIVHPGADYEDIKLRIDSENAVSVSKEGDLLISGNAGLIKQAKPHIYQVINDEKRFVEGAYKTETVPAVTADKTQAGIYGESTLIAFQIQPYDKNYPLIIDPVIDFSAYIAGVPEQTQADIDVDPDGNIYLTGNMNPIPLSASEEAAQTGSAGQGDIFIIKYRNDGSELEYVSYIGGGADDIVTGIVVDNKGQAYLTGHTESDDFPVINAYQANLSGMSDTFILSLDPDGNVISSTYIGGSDEDESFSITLDDEARVYIAGSTYSNDFPVLNPFQSENGGAGDGFIVKYDPLNAALQYATYLGGSDTDVIKAIALDEFAQVLGTGETGAADAVGDFPVMNALQGAFAGGGTDAFVFRLDLQLNELAFSTYLGGSGDESGEAISVDHPGSILVAGHTGSHDLDQLFTDTESQYSGGNSDGFLARLSLFGEAQEFSYIGGEGEESIDDLETNAAGQVFLSGASDSPELSIDTNSSLTNSTGNADMFLVVLENDLTHKYSKSMGGYLAEKDSRVSVDLFQNINITGITESADFPQHNTFESLSLSNTDRIFLTRTNLTSDLSLMGTEAADTIEGSAQNELIKGFKEDDELRGGEGDDIIYGGSGEDRLKGGKGNDLLIGGRGDDVYAGEAGSDTYFIEKLAGRDLVVNEDWNDPHSANTDLILFGSGIYPEQVQVSRDINHLYLTHESSGDELTVWYHFASLSARIDEIGFSSNNVRWDSESINAMFATSSEGDDVLYGFDRDESISGQSGNDRIEGGYGNDVLFGGEGNDVLKGNQGDDVLVGEAGNDTLTGATGSDVYLFSRGFGEDKISNQDWSDAQNQNLDVVRFEADIPPVFSQTHQRCESSLYQCRLGRTHYRLVSL